MKDFLFFKDPGDLIDLLQWRIALNKLDATIMEARLRECNEQHIAWLEDETR